MINLTMEILRDIDAWYKKVSSELEGSLKFFDRDVRSSCDKIQKIPTGIIKFQKTLHDLDIIPSEKISQGMKETLQAYERYQQNFPLIDSKVAELEAFFTNFEKAYEQFQMIHSEIMKIKTQIQDLTSQSYLETLDHLSKTDLFRTKQMVDALKKMNQEIEDYSQEIQTAYQDLENSWIQLKIVKILIEKTNYDETWAKYLSLEHEVQEIIQKTKKKE